jgi:hypothetical protein
VNKKRLSRSLSWTILACTSPIVDRQAERVLREEVRAAVSRLLGERELLTPGREDEERIRVLIHDQVAAYQRRAATTNVPLILDPDAVERRLFDSLLGLGILQPYMEAQAVEEIICNPHCHVGFSLYANKPSTDR